jgi:hypothetical protein
LPELRSRIPGHFLGEQLDAAVPKIEQWLTSTGRFQPVEATNPVSETYQAALAHFRQKQGLIEADVWQALRQANLPPSCLNDNNEYVAHGVSAALTLGDLNYLDVDVTWGEGLLKHYALPPDVLRRYLEIYHHAAIAHLDKRGQPIIAWLAQFIDKQTKHNS